MRRGEFALVSLAIAGMLAPSGSAECDAATLPHGWFVTGERAERYSATTVDHALQLSATNARAPGFGTAMQAIAATHYAGGNVRLTADVRTHDVGDWAGLWIRVDGRNANVLAFDNMQSRPIRGTTGWKSYSIVLPVAAAAQSISFGVLLSGNGTVWMKNVMFAATSESAPPAADTQLELEPNLTF